ncbi:MAG: hypothetical protein BWY83_02758 [bacterium ADurb.Bin478]|nr:MAG: hypothetical protein BWY83_02758 [bacterium ADurb.Bin478]
MNNIDQRIFFFRSEKRRFDQQTVDLFSVKTGEPEIFRRVQCQLIQQRPIEVGVLFDLPGGEIQRIDLIRRNNALLFEIEQPVVRSRHQAAVDMVCDDLFNAAGGGCHRIDAAASLVVSGEKQRTGVWRPDYCVDAAVQPAGEGNGLPGGAIKEHQLIAISLKARSLHSPVGEKSAVRRIERLIVIGFVGSGAGLR